MQPNPFRKLYWLGITGMLIGIIILWSSPAFAQGTTWTPPYKLSFDGISWFPDITSDAMGRVHVVWSAQVLYYRTWENRIWTPVNDIAVAVDSAGRPIWDPYRAAIAPDRLGYLHLVYYHLTEGLGLYARAQLDKAGNASNWKSQVIGSRGNGYYTALAVDSANHIHTVYIDMAETSMTSDLFYRRSEDSGITWTEPINLSNSPQAGASRPQIMIDQSDVIHVSWDEGWDRRSGEGAAETSRYVYSSNGKAWSATSIFGTPNTLPSAYLAVTSAMPGTKIAVWRAALDSDNNVYYQIYSEQTKNWSNPLPIPNVATRPWNSPPFDQYAMIRDDKGWVHLALVGRLNAETSRLAVIYLVWNGKQWSAPEVIFEQEGFYPEYPRMTIALGNQIHVVWFTRTNLWTQGTTDVWHSFKTMGTLYTPVPSFPTETINKIPSTPTTVTLLPNATPTHVPIYTMNQQPMSSEMGAMIPLATGIGATIVSFALALVARRVSSFRN
jgi:hypothetical protein